MLHRKKIRLLIATALLLTIGFGEANAAELSVPSQFSSIQAAIDAASPGDTITVAPDTYYESISFNGKDVHLRSSDGPEQTIIDGSGNEESVVQVRNGETEEAILEGFTITGGSGSPASIRRFGGGMLIYYSSATVKNCVFTNNQADCGGGLAMKSSSNSHVSNSVFLNNSSVSLAEGGGGICSQLSSSVFENIKVINNQAEEGGIGGGMLILSGGPIITNALFANNTAEHGGGIHNRNGRPLILNSTFSGNHANNAGGGIRNTLAFASAQIHNSIFWNNSAPFGNEILDQAYAQSTVYKSLVAGGWYASGSDNISADPKFLNADELDFRLSPDSPAVDNGSNSSYSNFEGEYISNYSGPETDLAENQRIANGVIDKGAYESHDGPLPDECAADLDEDGMVGFRDLNMLLSNWGLCVDCGADLDFDESVGTADLGIMLSSWGACG